MDTTVGTETEFAELVTNLIYLERDAIAAYDTSIERLSDGPLGQQIASFRQDHLDHLATLQEMAREIGADAPNEGDIKQILTTGKIALADLRGDGVILKAMKTNEDDTVAAYDQASRNDATLPKSKAFFARALADEKRHREWMEVTAKTL